MNLASLPNTFWGTILSKLKKIFEGHIKMYYKIRSIRANGIYVFFYLSKEYILITSMYKHNSE